MDEIDRICAIVDAMQEQTQEELATGRIVSRFEWKLEPEAGIGSDEVKAD